MPPGQVTSPPLSAQDHLAHGHGRSLPPLPGLRSWRGRGFLQTHRAIANPRNGPGGAESISVVALLPRGRAKARQARSAAAGDITENIVKAARQSITGLQPAEGKMDYW